MSKERGFPEIGSRLRSVRGERDQRGFSSQVNLSQQAISNYERGNLPASWGFLRHLLTDFDVNVNWLLSGEGQRHVVSGLVRAELADNRPPGWPRAFLEQVAFDETDTLELLLHIYFLVLATEPTDVKAKLKSDFQAIVEAARLNGEYGSIPLEERDVVFAAYDALARDDRRAAVAALIQTGERLESVEKRKALPRARKLYLAGLSLARFQGWREEQVETARRVGRSYRKEARWHDAEFFFRMAMALFEEQPDGGAPVEGDGASSDSTVSVGACSRTLLGYGHVAKEQGDIPSARERYLAALRWALKSPDFALRAEVYLDLACLWYREKKWQKALDLVESGRPFAHQAGQRRLINYYNLAEALVRREREELEGAESILRALHAQAEADQDLSTFTLASLNLAEVLIDQGSTDEALELLRSTETAAEAYGHPRNLALRKLLYARIEAAKGEDRAARAWIVDCMRYAKDQGLTAEFEQAAALMASEELRLQSVLKAG